MTRREVAQARAAELGIPFDRYTRVGDLEQQISEAEVLQQEKIGAATGVELEALTGVVTPEGADLRWTELPAAHDPMGGSYPR